MRPAVTSSFLSCLILSLNSGIQFHSLKFPLLRSSSPDRTLQIFWDPISNQSNQLSKQIHPIGRSRCLRRRMEWWASVTIANTNGATGARVELRWLGVSSPLWMLLMAKSTALTGTNDSSCALGTARARSNGSQEQATSFR